MVLDTEILAGMTALTKIFCPGLVGSRISYRKQSHEIMGIIFRAINKLVISHLLILRLTALFLYCQAMLRRLFVHK